MSEEARGNLTLGLWFLSAIVLVALFISAAAQGELTIAHMVFAATILAIAVLGTPFLWRWSGFDTEQAKAKRLRIDSLIGNLSDEELTELKQRLSDSDDNVKTIVDKIGDDGELIRRN